MVTAAKVSPEDQLAQAGLDAHRMHSDMKRAQEVRGELVSGIANVLNFVTRDMNNVEVAEDLEGLHPTATVTIKKADKPHLVFTIGADVEWNVDKFAAYPMISERWIDESGAGDESEMVEASREAIIDRVIDGIQLAYRFTKAEYEYAKRLQEIKKIDVLVVGSRVS